jgi:hypothetical protein
VTSLELHHGADGAGAFKHGLVERSLEHIAGSPPLAAVLELAHEPSFVAIGFPLFRDVMSTGPDFATRLITVSMSIASPLSIAGIAQALWRPATSWCGAAGASTERVRGPPERAIRQVASGHDYTSMQPAGSGEREGRRPRVADRPHRTSADSRRAPRREPADGSRVRIRREIAGSVVGASSAAPAREAGLVAMAMC